MTNATHFVVSAYNTHCWERIEVPESIRCDAERDLSKIELVAADFGGTPGQTYLVELVDANGEVINWVKLVAQ